MGMSLDDVKTIVMAGFKSTFLPFHVKQAMLREVNADLARFRANGTIDPGQLASQTPKAVSSARGSAVSAKPHAEA